ncbi:class D sortase [Bryobacter aggregatus]|uniref:class D sortase n=1 Tax=Bryobacter aggregatus TaxID=360054 RepID=UPI00068C4996|nr:class D sortase [Bryobacter aggregatus]
MSFKVLSRILFIAGCLSLTAGLTLLGLAQYGQSEALPPLEVRSSLISSGGPVPVWKDSDATAFLSCERLRANRVIFSDAGENLLRGPVWLTVTAPPGSAGNFVVAAHRDTHFRFLKDVRVGDIFEVDSKSGRFRYRVSGLHIVDPKNRNLLAPHEGGVLTLITCYPFYYLGSAPKRFIVRAELIKDNRNRASIISPVKVSPGESQ